MCCLFSVQAAHKMIETRIELSEEARFYANRMADLFVVRDHIDKYPLEYYSSDIEGRGVHVTQLKAGILRGIFGSYTMLHALGEGDIAEGMVNFDRLMHERQT